MRARVLFAGLVAISTVAIAGPASAKVSLAEANIAGPGLGGGMRIEAPETERHGSPESMWRAVWTTPGPNRSRSWD
jgi:hypothetical protein